MAALFAAHGFGQPARPDPLDEQAKRGPKPAVPLNGHGNRDGHAPPPPTPAQAAERGRSGGRKGGVARAEKLTPDARRRIAVRAAMARWNKQPSRGSKSSGVVTLADVKARTARAALRRRPP